MRICISTLFFLSLSILFAACQEFDYGYKSYEPDKADTYYTRRFANRDDVNVSITTETPGTPYFIYFENPYLSDEGLQGATPYLQGHTPLLTTLSVPRHIDSLYVVSPMRPMRVFAAGDIQIHDHNLIASTRVDITQKPYSLTDVPAYLSDRQSGTLQPHYYLSSDPHPGDGNEVFSSKNPEVTDELINYTNSVFQPGVVSPSELTKNTDLTFKGQTDDEYVAVWVTLLGHGSGDPDAGIWFYIYKDAATGPNPNDLKMLGFDSNKNLIESDLNKGKPAQGNYLFKLSEQQPSANPYPTVFIGYVRAGYNIGFCYQEVGVNGQEAKIRFTTPSLNAWAVQGGESTGGFIINREFGQHSFNIVGIEKYPGKKQTSDYDFNDALLLVETNPEIKPKEEIEITEIKTEISRSKGYYLFEDLYEPGVNTKNDNDFNDVVLYYEKVIYKITYGENTSYSCEYTAEKLANGCVNVNEVGVYHKAEGKDPERFVLYQQVTGQENMTTAPLYDQSNRKTFSFLLSSASDVILPYLRTTMIDGKPTSYDPTDPNNGNIYTTSYATKDFPYAMEIPFVTGSPFRWMKEGVCITEGYNWTDKSQDWYVNPLDASQLVPRTAGSTY